MGENVLPIYDQRGLVTGAAIPEGAWWKAIKRTSFRYQDGKGQSDRVRTALISAAAARPRTSGLAQGRGLSLPVLPATLPLRAQLVNDETGICWEAVFTNSKQNTTALLRGKLPAP